MDDSGRYTLFIMRNVVLSLSIASAFFIIMTILMSGKIKNWPFRLLLSQSSSEIMVYITAILITHNADCRNQFVLSFHDNFFFKVLRYLWLHNSLLLDHFLPHFAPYDTNHLQINQIPEPMDSKVINQIPLCCLPCPLHIRNHSIFFKFLWSYRLVFY